MGVPMGTLRVLATAAEKTPIELRQLTETKLKVGAAYDKLDEVKAQNPNATKILEKDFTGRGTHYSVSQKEFNQFDTYKSTGDAWETSGVHIGTDIAAAERAVDQVVKGGLMEKLQERSKVFTGVQEEVKSARKKGIGAVEVARGLFGGNKGHALDLRFREGKAAKGDLGIMTEDSARLWLEEQAYSPEFMQYLGKHWEEFKKSEDKGEWYNPTYLKAKTVDALSAEEKKLVAKTVYRNYGQLLGQFLADEKGYTHLPYVNAQEDAGSVSYIIFDPHKNLRRSDAAFMSEYGGLKAGVAGAAGAAGLAAQSNKSENKTTVKVKLKSKSNGT
jgi:hypothetical protein